MTTMFLYRRSIFLLPLLLSSACCTYQTLGCNVGTEGADIDQAVSDVVTMAITVVAALTTGKVNGNEDVFRGAYDPLFNHIQRRRTDPNRWEDTDYYSRPNGLRMPVGVKNGANKPGTVGSYTTIGYKHDDQWDTSSYSHIYIEEARRRPPASTQRDLRRYPDIVSGGLDKRYTYIENIKPLAQTVMHELLHAIGGLTDADPTTGKRSYRISDGPNSNMYGWLSCNKQRTLGISNANIADCITYLAQAIYLQIQGKDTYWSTGEVDPDTLHPKWLPGV
ncbi:hypothetical protein K491DRAFT_647027 [Lophiostoma macrostomum CBS 122681]|uniref:Lysine-specific metallo-endopeptidase domain-containing protein n=1 Tax=Lophiostoma macrostomum CBS 122681 TaxID=1314788 RepID=A0A6A6TNX9_9PLEO|nr:hypothetical protein K491DRAFT_647027 [Lophiostoma macrostomum CBS 122681]